MDKISRHSYSREERQKILDKTGCKCGHCGKPLDTHTMTVEHIFPISKGGTDDEFNLVALCRDCNYRKANYTYDIDDYYEYILPKYIPLFEFYSSGMNALNSNKNRILNTDATVFKFLPDRYKKLVWDMKKRGAKQSKIEQTIDKLTAKVILEKAYEGDAEEILAIINNNKSLVLCGSTLYSNVYAIRNDIKYGEAYVLRFGNKICGAIIFKKLKRGNIESAELSQIENDTILRGESVITLECYSTIIAEAVTKIINNWFIKIIQKSLIPIYFIDKDIISDVDDSASIPYNIDGIDGYLCFDHLDSIVNKMKKYIKGTFTIRSAYTEDEVDNIAKCLVGVCGAQDMSDDMTQIMLDNL